MKIKFRLLILTLMIALVSIPGVFATWKYAELSPVEAESSVYVSMGELVLFPEDVLPDDEEADQAQGNHLVLIQNIVLYTDYNINTGSKKVIEEYLDNFGVVYGNYKATSGGTLSKVLANQSPEAANVQFMMTKISETEYNAYTFSQRDLSNAEGNNAPLPDGYIEVYKTIIEYIETENGQMKWVATRSYIGKALTGECAVGEKNKTVYSIMYKTWVET